MTADHDQTALADPAASLRYLASDEALLSLDADCYWPKWNSPWWHMSLLFEMGLAAQIPAPAISRMVDRLKRSPRVFFRKDVPAGVDPRETHCHCALGNISQILCAAGVDLELEAPWIREWFLAHQLPDGGLNCDEDAYQADQPASSIVGTIAPLEAILLCTRRPFTEAEARFLDRGARCLLDRQLRLGNVAGHNVEEQEDEQDWLKLCFPRFYLYDVLRGLVFVLRWSELRRQPLSLLSIVPVVASLTTRFGDGPIRIERRSYDGIGTRVRSETGEWTRLPEASRFSLLDQVSEPGQVSPYLTSQWTSSKQLIAKLTREGLLS